MKKIALLLGIFFAAQSQAYENLNICARYQTNDNWTSSWSKGYKLQAQIYSGSELNKATKSYKYNSYDKYVLIWWGKDAVSIIKLDRSSISFYSYRSSGTDQTGRKWQLNEIYSSDNCY